MREGEELPEGWSSRTLDELTPADAPIQYGILQPGPDVPGGVPYVRPTEIRNDTIDVAALRCTSPAIAEKYRRAALKGGDVLLSIVGSIGKVAVVPASLNGANITQSSARIRPVVREVAPDFLAWFLRSPLARTQFDEVQLGTGVPRLNIGDVRKVVMPLPSLPEQERILDAVVRACDSVNGARERLSTVLSTLRRFRQTVLSSACTGKLTGKGGTNEVGREVPGSAITEGTSGDDSLPRGWRLLPCAEVIESGRVITYGVIKLGPPVAGGVPVLRSSDVRFLRIERANVKAVSPSIASAYGRTFLRGGEVVVTVRGTLGGVAAVPASMAGFNVSREVAVVPVRRDHDPEFIALAIASDQSQRWLSEVEKGVAYTGINIEDLKQLPLPIPPKAEQREIVRRVEALFALADATEKRVAAASARADKLTQAILAKAFRGELVPTEAELNRRREAAAATPPPAARSTAARPAPRRSR